MNLLELNEYFNAFLKKENFPADPSRNGIQIQNSDPEKKQIRKIAFAVDASLDTVKAASESGADVLFVHHGIFWGDCSTITGNHYRRIVEFVKNDIALIAYHLPLDANAEVGNNYGLARRIGLENLEDFFTWRGMTIGVKGTLPEPVTVEQLESLVLNGKKANHVLPYGKKEIRSVGIVSGGGSSDHEAASAAGLDAFITGEIEHADFNPIKEEQLNAIAGGHYATETVGVSLVMKKVLEELGDSEKIECCFLDFPSGL